jgi:hypothetical protein
MGNQRGTESLKHHWTKTYMKRLNKRKLDKLQKIDIIIKWNV